MRTYHSRTGDPEFTELTDIPGPTETLEDLENASRRPLRVAAGDSLLRTFKRCHDYLYGNQQMRPDKAFWQLLYLIFCKILDEQQSSRLFFVGATEANSELAMNWQSSLAGVMTLVYVTDGLHFTPFRGALV